MPWNPHNEISQNLKSTGTQNFRVQFTLLSQLFYLNYYYLPKKKKKEEIQGITPAETLYAAKLQKVPLHLGKFSY